MALTATQILNNTLTALAEVIEDQLKNLEHREKKRIPASHEDMSDFLLLLTRTIKREITRE